MLLSWACYLAVGHMTHLIRVSVAVLLNDISICLKNVLLQMKNIFLINYIFIEIEVFQLGKFITAHVRPAMALFKSFCLLLAKLQLSQRLRLKMIFLANRHIYRNVHECTLPVQINDVWLQHGGSEPWIASHWLSPVLIYSRWQSFNCSYFAFFSVINEENVLYLC